MLRSVYVIRPYMSVKYVYSPSRLVVATTRSGIEKSWTLGKRIGKKDLDFLPNNLQIKNILLEMIKLCFFSGSAYGISAVTVIQGSLYYYHFHTAPFALAV